MSSLIRLVNISRSFLYFIFLKFLYGGRFKFDFPRVGLRSEITICRGGKLDVKNLSARNDLNIYIDKGILSFGVDCFVNNGCSFNCIDSIVIGDRTMFGEGVKIYDHNHFVDSDFIASKKEFSTSPIYIGSDCWIGSNVVILKGVTIVDRVVVGANTLINKSILEPGVYVSKSGSLYKLK